MNEFEDEEPYEEARHSFQQYDQDGGLGSIFDPCEIFADEPEQKYIEDDLSMIIRHLKLVSSSNRFTNSLSERAYNFQSM